MEYTGTQDRLAEALVAAISCGEEVRAIDLLKEGADPNAIDREDNPVLCLAIERGSIAVLRELLDRNVDTRTDDLEWTFSPGLKALHLCFENPEGKETIMTMLLDHNIELGDPKDVEGLGHQIWSWAVKNDYRTVLGKLLERGVPVDLRSEEAEGIGEDRFGLRQFSKQTAFYSAVEMKNNGLACWLLNHGAHPDCGGYQPSPLLRLCTTHNYGASGMILTLLHEGANPNVFDQFTGKSVLSLLCDHYSPHEAASLALDRSTLATINSKCKFRKMTALHYACRSSTPCVALVEQFVVAGAKVNSTDGKGHTPLWHVANFGNMQNADILIRNGALVDEHIPGSTTPLMEAARYNAPELVMHLVKVGADVNAISGEQYVLRGAIERPDHKAKMLILRYLLEIGASPVLPNESPRQPLLDAITITGFEERSQDCIATLLRAVLESHGSIKLRSILQGSSSPLFTDRITRAAFEEVGMRIFDDHPPKETEQELLNTDEYEIMAIINAVDKRWETPTIKHLQWRAIRSNVSNPILRPDEAAGRFFNPSIDLASESSPGIVNAYTFGFTAAGSRGDASVFGFPKKATADPGAEAADDYMKRLRNRRHFLLDSVKIEPYNPVRIAILDSGIDANHLADAYIEGYYDFVSETDSPHLDENETRHGTNCVSVTLSVVPDAHVYVGRVYKEDPTDTNSPSTVAKAIQHAVDKWQVHIISMSFGFKYEHENIVQAILNAQAAGALVFAAVGNSGNRQEPAFPANLKGPVIGISSTNGMVKSSTQRNPAPSPLSVNFGFLGENVLVRTARGGGQRVSGTSLATPIAAATAAIFLDFSKREDCKALSERNKLRRVEGMSAVFMRLSTQESSFYCFNPWSEYLEPSDLKAPSDTLKRQYICGTLDRVL